MDTSVCQSGGPGLCLDGRALITSIFPPPCKNRADNSLPPTCCREMKALAESFELCGGNALENQKM